MKYYYNFYNMNDTIPGFKNCYPLKFNYNPLNSMNKLDQVKSKNTFNNTFTDIKNILDLQFFNSNDIVIYQIRFTIYTLAKTTINNVPVVIYFPKMVETLKKFLSSVYGLKYMYFIRVHEDDFGISITNAINYHYDMIYDIEKY